MATSNNSKDKQFDSVAAFSIALSIVSLIIAAIIEALAAGGVISMKTVTVFIWIAVVLGILSSGLAAIWLKRWLREGILVAIGIGLSLSFCLAGYYLYVWIEKNGIRPSLTQASNNAAILPLHRVENAKLKAGSSSASPKIDPQSSTQAAHKKVRTKSAINKNSQSMDHSPNGVQQQSNGPDSPNLSVAPGGVGSIGQTGGFTGYIVQNPKIYRVLVSKEPQPQPKLDGRCDWLYALQIKNESIPELRLTSPSALTITIFKVQVSGSSSSSQGNSFYREGTISNALGAYSVFLMTPSMDVVPTLHIECPGIICEVRPMPAR